MLRFQVYLMSSLAKRLHAVTLLYASESELRYRMYEHTQFAGRNYWIPISAAVVYVLLVHWGQNVMRRRTEFNLKLIVFLWHSLLFFFSFAGMCRTVSSLV